MGSIRKVQPYRLLAEDQSFLLLNGSLLGFPTQEVTGTPLQKSLNTRFSETQAGLLYERLNVSNNLSLLCGFPLAGGVPTSFTKTRPGQQTRSRGKEDVPPRRATAALRR